MYRFISKRHAFKHYIVYAKIFKAYFENYLIAFRQWKIKKRIANKDCINVVFLPMNVAMWKCQHLYELLAQDKRFRLYIFLAPATTFSYEARCEDLRRMRDYFTQRNMPFVDYELEKGKEAVPIDTIVNPDIMFYAQPYERVIEDIYNYRKFNMSLVCYIPYSFRTTNNLYFNDNLRFNNIAWKLYYSTLETKVFAQKYAYNHGRNVVVVGYPSSDEYALPMKRDPWKIKDRKYKRIIWAPHFTIINGVGFSQVSNFLNMAMFMRNLAINYRDKITIAFKPHPRLYSELEKHPEWGEERTKEYYDFWENFPTSQLETGDFIDLFKGSDAMIHDSSSFTVDYLYFNKPVLYDNPDIEGAKATANETSKAAYDVHYKVSSNEDIKRFIDDVVIAGNDPMKVQREEYYQHYLLPPNGKSVAQNIYDDMTKSLGLK